MITDNIRLFTQSSIRIEGKYVIYVDPFHMKTAPYDADVIFLTHDHYDHFSPDDIARIIKSDTKIVAPEKMAGKARTVVPPKGELILVRPGERYEIPGLIIETIPAYNAKMQFHPRSAGWTGYCLEEDGQRIYISGDTDNTKQAQQVKCDVALVPIGGTFTMDAHQAAELINRIHPCLAIPTHYGSIVGRPEDAEIFRQLVNSDTLVENRMEYFD